MRKVREIVTPDKEYVRDIQVRQDDEGDTEKDTLEVTAIQRRLSRYGQQYEELHFELSYYVLCYLTDLKVGLHRKGTTFLSRLPQVLNHTNL